MWSLSLLHSFKYIFWAVFGYFSTWFRKVSSPSSYKLNKKRAFRFDMWYPGFFKWVSVIMFHKEHIYLCKSLGSVHLWGCFTWIQHGSLKPQDQNNNGRQDGDENEAEHTLLTPKIRWLRHAESLKLLFEVTESMNNGKKN